MSIRIRIYPQAGSIGARRNRAMRMQSQMLHLQQLRFRQQASMLQQQLGGFGGYGMQPGAHQYGGFGMQQGMAQFGGYGGVAYGSASPYATGYATSVNQYSPVGQYPPACAPTSSAWSGASYAPSAFVPAYGYTTSLSPFAGMASALSGLISFGGW